MTTEIASTTGTHSRTRYWPWFLAGVSLAILGPALYVLQFQLHKLWLPIYVPVLATLGVVAAAVSVWRRPGFGRGAGLVLLVALCGLEWLFLLVFTRPPDYTGPAQPGVKVPPFETCLADGKIFTEKDLANGEPTLLVFFRGRW